MLDYGFTLVSGTYTTEQDMFWQLDSFLTGTAGWTREKIITDSPTEARAVYYTDGNYRQYYDRFWIRLQASSDYLYFVGMSQFDSDTNTEHDSIYYSGVTRIPVVSSGTY